MPLRIKKESVVPLENQVKNSEDVHILNDTAHTIINELVQLKKPSNFTNKVEAGLGLCEIFETSLALERQSAGNMDFSPQKFFVDPYSRYSITYKKGYMQQLKSSFYREVEGDPELIQSAYLYADREIFLVKEVGQVPTIAQGQKNKKVLNVEVKSYLDNLMSHQKSKPETPDYIVARSDVKFEANVDTSKTHQNSHTVDLHNNTMENFVGSFGNTVNPSGKGSTSVTVHDTTAKQSIGRFGTITIGHDSARRVAEQNHMLLEAGMQERVENRKTESLKEMITTKAQELKAAEAKLEAEEDKQPVNESRRTRLVKKVENLEKDKSNLEQELIRLLSAKK